MGKISITTQMARDAIDKHGTNVEAARQLGCTLSSFYRALKRNDPPDTKPGDDIGCRGYCSGNEAPKKTSSAQRKKVNGGLSKQQLLMKYDKVAQCEADIDKEIEKGFKGGFYPMAMWRERCGHGATANFHKAAANAKYDQYKFIINNETVWCDPEDRDESVKEMPRARAYTSRK